MEIILIQDVEKLGQKDDVIKVKDGYARNFLIPQKIAIKATESAKKIVAENKKQRVFKEAKTRNEALEMAAKLQNLKITIGAKTSTSGKIFGSVNTIMIAEAINKNGFEIDRKQISLEEDHIKEVGNFSAKIKLYKDVIIDFGFEVVAE
jgi:large subunit ribosomal protein L9